MNPLIRQMRRLIIAVVGVTVLVIGVAMIVLPGPAVVVIPLGLSILALEFAWAKRLLKRVKEAAGMPAETPSGKADGGRSDAPPEPERRASGSRGV